MNTDLDKFNVMKFGEEDGLVDTKVPAIEIGVGINSIPFKGSLIKYRRQSLHKTVESALFMQRVSGHG